jgi:hypothetical protein
MLRIAFFVIFATAIILCQPIAKAEPIKLRVPDVSTTDYVVNLLTASFEKIGQRVEFVRVDANFNMARQMVMFETGAGLDLIWRGENPELKKKYLEVEIDITNGLKGYRVMLINPNDRELYRNIKTLEEFQALGTIAALGAGWNDIDVWLRNGLEVQEFKGVWNPAIYQLLALGDRGIDYFPRGIIEISGEAALHPDLIIEPHIGLVYANDFRFYVTRANKELHALLTRALKISQEDGTLLKILKQANPDVYDPEKIDIEGRTIIELEMP